MSLEDGVLVEAAAPVLRADPPLADEARQAAVTVCAHSADAAAARPVLEMLGLLEPAPPLEYSEGERKRFGSRVVHGTRSAVEEHREAGTRLCTACRRWVAVYGRDESWQERPARCDDPRCGTITGAFRHSKRGERACQACADARYIYDQERKANPDAYRRRPPAPCGTRAAYQRHSQNGEEPCEKCREAARIYERIRIARKRQP